MFGLIFGRFILIVTLILFVLSSFAQDIFGDEVLNSLPRSESKETYYQKDGWQDYTDYAKYHYDDVTVDDLKGSGYFHEVTVDDVENLESYYNDFYGWWIAVHSDRVFDYDDDYDDYEDYEDHYEYDEYFDKFDFDIEQIEAGDYFYIDTLEGQPIGNRYYLKFENYTVYYFDLESQTLYYFHNNT